MKQLDNTIVEVEETVAKALAHYEPDMMEHIEAMLALVIKPHNLKGINTTLTGLHLRKIDLKDVAKIAYIHTLSINENDGFSPYTRIMAYAKKCGDAFNEMHIKTATEILLAVEFMHKIGEADHGNKLCRQYRLAEDVKQQLYSRV